MQTPAVTRAMDVSRYQRIGSPGSPLHGSLQFLFAARV